MKKTDRSLNKCHSGGSKRSLKKDGKIFPRAEQSSWRGSEGGCSAVGSPGPSKVCHEQHDRRNIKLPHPEVNSKAYLSVYF